MNRLDVDYFARNRKSLRLKNPSLELLLALTSRVNPSFDNQNRWNLPLSPQQNDIKLHDPNDPEKEAREHYTQLTQSHYDRLFLFGIGLGYGLDILLKWLDAKESRDLIIMENHLNLLKSFISTTTATPILAHPRVHLFWSKSPNFWIKNKNKIEYFLSQPFNLSCLPYQRQQRKKEFEEIKNQLIDRSIDLNVYCSEYLQTTPLVYSNFLHNLLKISECKHIYALKNAFKGIPALICGAGPSLNNHTLEIGDFKAKGLLFAGGRALSVLSDLGIEPHFALGIDPFEQLAQTHRCNSYFEIPFFYRLRTSYKALDLLQGPKLYVPGAIGYSFIEWLEKELSIFSFPFQEGLNVVNFNIVIAHYLGCQPIVLTGCDLAYQNEAAYSCSIPDEQLLPDSHHIDESDLSLNRGFFKQGNHDKPVFTLWKWIEEAKWISTYAQNHPQLKIYNTSESGLKIEHTEVKSLKEILLTFYSQKQNYEDKIHASIQKAPFIEASPKQIKLALIKMLKSILILKKLFAQCLFLGKETPSYFLIYDTIEKEPAYQHLLKPFEELFLRLDPSYLKKERTTRKIKFLEKKRFEFQQIFETFMKENF